MDNFKVIYKILKLLEKHMDCEEFQKELIDNEQLGISSERWSRIIKMMVDNGLIEGIRIVEYDGQTVPQVRMYAPAITLSGLEYLEENSLMKKAANIAKGIKDTVPGL